MTMTMPMTVAVSMTVPGRNIERTAAVALTVGTSSPDVATGHRELPVLTISST
jgi:hypothetical protein